MTHPLLNLDWGFHILERDEDAFTIYKELKATFSHGILDPSGTVA